VLLDILAGAFASVRENSASSAGERDRRAASDLRPSPIEEAFGEEDLVFDQSAAPEKYLLYLNSEFTSRPNSDGTPCSSASRPASLERSCWSS